MKEPSSGGPILAVAAVVCHAERLLLVRRGRPPYAGAWSLPGGRVEAHESLAEAVAREVKEETALDVVPGDLLGWVERHDADSHFVILDFVASPAGALDRLQAGDDASEAAWVALNEVGELDLVPGLLGWLRDHGVVT